MPARMRGTVWCVWSWRHPGAVVPRPKTPTMKRGSLAVVAGGYFTSSRTREHVPQALVRRARVFAWFSGWDRRPFVPATSGATTAIGAEGAGRGSATCALPA